MKHEALGLSMMQLAKSVCHHLKVSHKPMFQALLPKKASTQIFYFCVLMSSPY